ncbi:MAG: hypothetical protein ACPHXR_08140 [Flavicella sp.]
MRTCIVGICIAVLCFEFLFFKKYHSLKQKELDKKVVKTYAIDNVNFFTVMDSNANNSKNQNIN